MVDELEVRMQKAFDRADAGVVDEIPVPDDEVLVVETERGHPPAVEIQLRYAKLVGLVEVGIDDHLVVAADDDQSFHEPSVRAERAVVERVMIPSDREWFDGDDPAGRHVQQPVGVVGVPRAAGLRARPRGLGECVVAGERQVGRVAGGAGFDVAS